MRVHPESNFGKSHSLEAAARLRLRLEAARTEASAIVGWFKFDLSGKGL